MPRRPGARVFPLGPGVLERVADTVTPQPVLAVVPMLDDHVGARTPWPAADAAAGRRAGRRARPGQRRHRAAGGRRLGVDARSSSAPSRSTPTTPRRSGPRPARSSTSPSPCSTTRRRRRRAWPARATARWPPSCGTARTTPHSTGQCPTAVFLGNESAGLDPALSESLDGDGGHPDGGPGRVAQRGGGVRGGLLRGAPATPGGGAVRRRIAAAERRPILTARNSATW